MEPSLLITFLPLAIIFVIAWAITRVIKKVAKKYPPVAPEQSTVSGVGGWLLFLIIGLMFLGPLMGAARINSDIMSTESVYPNLKTVALWSTYKSATWCIFLFVACLGFYAGLGLVKGRTTAIVNRAKIIIWIIGPASGLILGVFLPIFIFGKFEPTTQFVGGVIASVIFALIWTGYLSNSKRVRATYGYKMPITKEHIPSDTDLGASS